MKITENQKAAQILEQTIETAINTFHKNCEDLIVTDLGITTYPNQQDKYAGILIKIALKDNRY